MADSPVRANRRTMPADQTGILGPWLDRGSTVFVFELDDGRGALVYTDTVSLTFTLIEF